MGSVLILLFYPTHTHAFLFFRTDGSGQDLPVRDAVVDVAGELFLWPCYFRFSHLHPAPLPQRQSPDARPAVDKAVIVCPSSLVKNWANEFKKWLHGRVPTMPIDSGSRDEITKKLQGFLTSTGRAATPVLIISYETLRGHADTMAKGKIGLVICDEVRRSGKTRGIDGVSQSLHPFPNRATA